MPPGDDQRMTLGDGESVSYCKCLSVGFQNTLYGQTTERTVTRLEVAHSTFRCFAGTGAGSAPDHSDQVAATNAGQNGCTRGRYHTGEIVGARTSQMACPASIVGRLSRPVRPQAPFVTLASPPPVQQPSGLCRTAESATPPRLPSPGLVHRLSPAEPAA